MAKGLWKKVTQPSTKAEPVPAELPSAEPEKQPENVLPPAQTAKAEPPHSVDPAPARATDPLPQENPDPPQSGEGKKEKCPACDTPKDPAAGRPGPANEFKKTKLKLTCRQSVSLARAEDEDLTALAWYEDISESALIRKAIRELLVRRREAVKNAQELRAKQYEIRQAQAS